MKLTKQQITGMVLGIGVLAVDMLFMRGTAWFIPLIAVGLILGLVQVFADYFLEQQKQRELEMRFPDFVRNLVGAIRSGMPAPRAIVHIADADYGYLSPFVKKLANQVEWNIPVHKAFVNFSRETNNRVIRRSISTVIEAEMSGGNIEDVLETITDSVIKIKKIKQERKASIHSQVMQSYVIFAVFLGVMVIIQNLLIPYVARMGQSSLAAEAGGSVVGAGMSELMRKVTWDFSSFPNFISSAGSWFGSIYGVFLMLALIQGLFAGLVIGKLSEGQISAGLRHSLILMAAAFFIISLAQGAV